MKQFFEKIKMQLKYRRILRKLDEIDSLCGDLSSYGLVNFAYEIRVRVENTRIMVDKIYKMISK